MHRRAAATSGGFTLIEVVVVTALLGLIAAVLAGVFVAVVRTAPSNAERIDVARVAQGLVTWLPQDVDSTIPSGFNPSPTASTGCTGGSPGVNLLQMRWSEVGALGTSITFVASYRHVTVGLESRIERYTCSGPSGPPYGAPQLLVVARNVQPLPVGWTPGSAPARIALTTSGAAVLLVEFDVTTTSGKVITIDAAPKNPDVTLPPTTIPGTSTTSTTTATTTSTTPPTTTTTIPAATSTTSTTTTSTTTTSTTVPCVVSPISLSHNNVRLSAPANATLVRSVEVQISWSGGCQGLYLAYDSGDAATHMLQQNFLPTTSSTPTVVLVGADAGGSERWTVGDHLLTVQDTNNSSLSTAVFTTRTCAGQGC